MILQTQIIWLFEWNFELPRTNCEGCYKKDECIFCPLKGDEKCYSVEEINRM